MNATKNTQKQIAEIQSNALICRTFLLNQCVHEYKEVCHSISSYFTKKVLLWSSAVPSCWIHNTVYLL